ncbi:MAG: helix-turn-helix transcriptional regulator [Lactobacillus sp.]|nr:helix-turn-helix transcriptional regulator [Lactobacillus sp.]
MNQKLIKLRQSKNLSQIVAAQEIGISQSMLSSLENNKREASDKVKTKIAKYYGRSIQYIFFS